MAGILLASRDMQDARVRGDDRHPLGVGGRVRHIERGARGGGGCATVGHQVRVVQARAPTGASLVYRAVSVRRGVALHQKGGSRSHFMIISDPGSDPPGCPDQKGPEGGISDLIKDNRV